MWRNSSGLPVCYMMSVTGLTGIFLTIIFLKRWGLTHEVVGQNIIVQKLGADIALVRRSPSGAFARGEIMDARRVAFLIKMPEVRGAGKQPRWLQMLRQLFSGVYTVDNLDYVQRDAYMTGFSLDMVDIPRLRYYTFFYQRGSYSSPVGNFQRWDGFSTPG